MAMHPLQIPPYVLLEIIDRLPDLYLVNHVYVVFTFWKQHKLCFIATQNSTNNICRFKIKLLINVTKSCQKIIDARKLQ
jgi:hypothetical protein